MTASLPAPNLKRAHDLYLSALDDAGGTLVAVTGELDAASAPAFTAYAKAHASPGARLTVDLSRLKFFAVEGFTAIQEIRAHCNRTGTTWMLIPGSAVTRVLNVCDPNRRPLAVRSLKLVAEPSKRARQ